MEDTLRETIYMRKRFRLDGLNPYSNGRYYTRGGEHGHAEHPAAEVLILILMEDTLRVMHAVLSVFTKE